MSATQASAEARADITAEAAEGAGAADAALGLNPLVGFGTIDMLVAFQQIAARMASNPLALLDQVGAFARNLGAAWLGRDGIDAGPGDKRFADPSWTSNPLYRNLKQVYLASAQATEGWIDRAGFDPQNEPRVRMLLSLLIDAVAPTNTLLGNPAAVRKLIETGGLSAARGLTHMLEDIARNGGLPAQVDKKGFRVGENLAASPGAVVFRNDMLELIQYEPRTEQVHSRPLLIVPPQINKFYLFDLAPGRSLIEFLTSKGIQVFALSWRNPTSAHRGWGLERYVSALLEAIDAVREITGNEDINLAAACSGGITASLLLALLAARGDRRVHTATLLVTVLDTSTESQIRSLVTHEAIQIARLASRQKGVLEGQQLARVFAWMRPNDLVWNYWVNNYLLGNDPPAFDILYWNSDTTRLPAALHSDYLDLYLHNPLPRPGVLRLFDSPIDLSKVACDTFIVAGMTDHITPWQACYATTRMLGGSKEFVLSSSGHIQSIINPPGNHKARFFRNEDLAIDAAAWFAAAQPQSGSWWDYWLEWLVARSGEQTPARNTLGRRAHSPGERAPGAYVFEP